MSCHWGASGYQNNETCGDTWTCYPIPFLHNKNKTVNVCSGLQSFCTCHGSGEGMGRVTLRGSCMPVLCAYGDTAMMRDHPPWPHRVVDRSLHTLLHKIRESGVAGVIPTFFTTLPTQRGTKVPNASSRNLAWRRAIVAASQPPSFGWYPGCSPTNPICSSAPGLTARSCRRQRGSRSRPARTRGSRCQPGEFPYAPSIFVPPPFGCVENSNAS